LVRATQDGLAYSAWLPSPLPPRIEFDAQLAGGLADASAALGELAGVGRSLPNPHLLLGPFMRKEAVLSSRIEGTRATITDLYAYEAGQLPLPGLEGDDRDAREVLNYVEALEAGLARIKDYPISLALVEDLHRALMRDVRGKEKTPGVFRVRQNLIGPPDATLETATYTPPPTILMKDCLADLQDYIQKPADAYPKLVRLALIHYQFEAIHPFNDGNGRVGRLLVSLLTVHWNLLPIPLLYLSAYFEQNRDEYYDLLQGVTEKGDWYEWTIYFLRGVAEQSADATARAKRLQDLRERMQDAFAAQRASALAARLVTRLFEQPVLTIGNASEMLGVSYHNARRQVHRLVEAGILTAVPGRGRQDVYVASEILAVVQD
jgi:Fic family protein